MRVGIDARALTGRYTGDRTYWLNLLTAMQAVSKPTDEYFIYSRTPIEEPALPRPPGWTFRPLAASNDRTWTLFAWPRALKSDRIDIGHSQYTLPLRAHCPLITTVHDVSFKLHPEWFPVKHRLLMNLTVPPSMARAVLVITDSEGSRTDILAHYRLAADKVVAILLAAGPRMKREPEEYARAVLKERFRIDGPFILAVGVLQPRKNLPMLLEAFARARKMCPSMPHRLVITGKTGWAADDIEAAASRLALGDSLVMTDYVDDDLLPLLYTAADAVAHPALYEGFGLPPLEAMACGTATLVSDAPVMPEVVKDGAHVLPVSDIGAWAEAIVRVATDMGFRDNLRARALARAKELSWERTAALTYFQYERVLEMHGDRPERTHRK